MSEPLKMNLRMSTSHKAVRTESYLCFVSVSTYNSLTEKTKSQKKQEM